MSKSFITRSAFVVSVLALAACSQAPRDSNPRLTDPLPPPGPISSGGPVVQPQYGANPAAQDIVLRGAAYAASGDGRFPPNSVMTVRVYDAARGDVNSWEAEETFTRSGGLPWPYQMGFRTEALRGVQQPALAARIEGPDGRLIYQSQQVVPLVEGGSEDIPMSPVGGGSAAAVGAVDQYTDAPIQRQVQTSYGIPDDRASYGTPRYGTPTYSGQSYQPSTLSGPPSNGVF